MYGERTYQNEVCCSNETKNVCPKQLASLALGIRVDVNEFDSI